MVGFPDTGTVNYVPAGTNNSIAAIFFCMLVPVYCLNMTHLPLIQLTNRNCANQMVTSPWISDIIKFQHEERVPQNRQMRHQVPAFQDQVHLYTQNHVLPEIMLIHESVY